MGQLSSPSRFAILKTTARWACVLLLAMASAQGASKSWWEKLDPATLPAANLPMAEVIDRCIDQKLKQSDVMPALTAPLQTRLRRLMLDLHGRVPMISELEAFVTEGDSPEAWARLVDRLIAAPAFDRHLANELNWLLMDGQGTEFQKYLDLAVTTKKGWDVVFREAIEGQADSAARPGVDRTPRIPPGLVKPFGRPGGLCRCNERRPASPTGVRRTHDETFLPKAGPPLCRNPGGGDSRRAGRVSTAGSAPAHSCTARDRSGIRD